MFALSREQSLRKYCSNTVTLLSQDTSIEKDNDKQTKRNQNKTTRTCFGIQE